jgi:hypothetical protein
LKDLSLEQRLDRTTDWQTTSGERLHCTSRVLRPIINVSLSLIAVFASPHTYTCRVDEQLPWPLVSLARGPTSNVCNIPLRGTSREWLATFSTGIYPTQDELPHVFYSHQVTTLHERRVMDRRSMRGVLRHDCQS